MIEHIDERFEQRNIQAFREKLWALGDQYNISIAREIIRLCDLIVPKYRTDFREADWLVDQAKRKLASTDNHQSNTKTLADALQYITQEKLLGVRHIPAFLASDLLLTSYDHDKFEQYKALTLLCIARLAFMGQHRSRIERICVDMRLFSRGERESLAAYMPDIHTLNFPQLVMAFQELVKEEDNPDLPPPTIVNQLNHYRRPFEASLNYTDGILRRSGATAFNRINQLDISNTKFLEEDKGESLIEIREIAKLPTKNRQEWQKEDLSHDVDRSFSVVTTQSKNSNDYAVNALHARAINARIQKREMALSCDISNMTKFEVGVIINYCTSAIEKRVCDEDLAKALLIMLFTGNTLELVKKLKAKRNRQRQLLGFQRNHKVPSQKQRPEIQPLLAQFESSFWLPLPCIVCTNLKSLAFSDISENDLNNMLKIMNRKHGTHITMTKVTSYIQQLFAHENIDPVYSALIRGTAINEIPALYYTHLRSEQLIEQYLRYLKHLSKFYADDPTILNHFYDRPKVEFYGSSLYFEESLLQTLFSSLYKKIYQLIQNNYITDSTTHNLITLYTQLALSLSSGYRPVTGWFGKRNHINLDTGDYWISDKESGFGDNSRVIVLPQRMLILMHQYLNLCSMLAIAHSNISQALSHRYQQVLSSEEHLFFYIEENEIVECKPSTYSKQIDSIFPIQPNWARHHIRSLLLSKNIDTALISAWMGHYNQNKRALHSHSHLNRKQYRTIAELIDHYLERIGIKVSPWQK